MKIKCGNCSHSEETNVGFFVKLIGGVLPGVGLWAWVAYFFAGTGLALPIVTAMVIGGSAMLVYKDEITQWIINTGYECDHCGQSEWEA